MQFGVNSYVWASPFSTATDLALLAKTRALGFDLFEVSVEDPSRIDLAALYDTLQTNNLGLIICGAFTGERDLSSADREIRENAKAYCRWCIDAAQSLGSPLVVGPMYSAVGKPHPDNVSEIQAERERSISALRELGAYAGAHDVRIGLEVINRFETDMLNTTRQAVDFVEEIDNPNVGIHLDTFHMHIEEKDMPAAFQLAGQHLFHVHASECDRGTPGSGQVNWKGTAAALNAMGYNGAVVIESFAPGVQSIARAASIWRPLAPDQDTIARDGLHFLKHLFANSA